MSECKCKKCKLNIAKHGGASCSMKYCSPRACEECDIIMDGCVLAKDKGMADK